MEQKKESFILDFLNRSENFFLDDKDEVFSINQDPSIVMNDFVFYKVECITFEEKAPRKEALENVLSSMRIPGYQFVYLIKGDEKGVSFYYGISRDLIQKIENVHEAKEYGEVILKPCLEGNFQGSKICQVNQADAKALMEKLRTVKYTEVMDGVPGLNEDSEKYQGADRLVNVMRGDEFMFLIVAKPLLHKVVLLLEKNIFELYDKLMPLSKKNIQKGSNDSKTTVDTKTTGTNTSHCDGTQKGSVKNFGKALQTSRASAKPVNNRDNETRTESETSIDNTQCWQENSGSSSSDTKNTVDNKTTGENKTAGSSSTTSYDFVNKDVQEWLKYIEEVLLKRLDYGKGKGLFITSMALLTNSSVVMQKLSNTVSTLYSCGTGNKVALRKSECREGSRKQSNVKNLQIPIGLFNQEIESNEIFVRTALSQYVTAQKAFLGNWLSVNELAVVAGLPQKEVVGLSLREEVEFGLNYKSDIKKEDSINLGKLVQSGNVLNIPVCLDKKELNKHTFVTGVTGSGKTTTCQKILLESGDVKFMVIEPAKTEYRSLKQKYKDILVFTLGNDSVAPFRINPFEFYPHESISSHVDMIKACIESAFDMEAAIPQIIEKSIYECYVDCGWDLATNKNSKYKDPFADGVYAFPTLSELIQKTEYVVEQQGFDLRLKNDYIGSIKARLQGLVVGSKGLMLDTKRSVDFKDLIHRRVILEMEEIRSGSEKSLIMGLLMSNLIEAIKAEHLSNPDFSHITLIEEAHRLFSKYQFGDSLNKKNSVEIFSDMLAEVRKYGESLIIVDQIPEKMTPEVLKNTNTKIVHKIFAKDDKDVIGDTMALSENQKQFLSFLDKGRAVVFSQGWDSCLQVQITPKSDTSAPQLEINSNELRKSVVEYYCTSYSRGVYPFLACLNNRPRENDFERFLSLQSDFDELVKQYRLLLNILKMTEKFKDALDRLLQQKITNEQVARYINNEVYFGNLSNEKINAIYSLLDDARNGVSDLSKYNEVLTNNIRRK